MARRESTLLLMWGATAFWCGIAAALATGVWLAMDLGRIDWERHTPISDSFTLRVVVVDRLILLACCHMVSLLGAITYRLSQAS